MIKIEDYSNPFHAIFDFEDAVARYTGAKYCITTDCCTHAIEIAFRLRPTDHVEFPAHTYLSVPMTMRKLGVDFTLTGETWRDSYQFKNSNIWDCARLFKQDMYVPGTIQCISFGRSKPLEIGQGGCILTDDEDFYNKASKMRYDGRDLRISPWIAQTEFSTGYHYYMRPEECVTGLNMLSNKQFIKQEEKHFVYPDCRTINYAGN